MRNSLFRYSGNKGRLIPCLRFPPSGTKRVLESFLGSGSYTLNHNLPGVGIDADQRVIDLWHWLQGGPDLDLLGQWWETRRGGGTAPPNVKEVEDLFGYGAALYFKINVCGAYVGQWSSTTTYPQHSLPVKKTKEALLGASLMDARIGSWEDTGALIQEGDLVFFDPPYKGTHGNYKKEGSFDYTKILETIKGWNAPIIFTYGDGATELFPGLPWEVATKRKVPKLRCGGTIERTEWVAYINWDK